MSYVFLMTIVLLVSIGQLLQKITANQLAGIHGLFPALKTMARSPPFWLAVVVMAFGLLTWLLALTSLEVSKAYPVLGLSFVLTTGLSVFFLSERVNGKRWLGICLITCGATIMLTI